MRRMVPCAYLRVFRPLDSFPEPERARWERYILGGGVPDPGRPRYRELSQAPPTPFPFLEVVEGDHAEVRLEEGRFYVCPWRTHLRALAGIVAMREVPEEEGDPLVSEADARRAARELARLRRHDPSQVPTMVQSAWHVPVRWFVLFDDAERRLAEDANGEWLIRYWAPADAASERGAKAARVLRRAGLHSVSALVKELVDWLSPFDRDTTVELDYGTVGSLFTWDELDDDRSALDVGQALEALRIPGGMGAAAERYQVVAARWAETRARESLN